VNFVLIVIGRHVRTNSRYFHRKNIKSKTSIFITWETLRLPRGTRPSLIWRGYFLPTPRPSRHLPLPTLASCVSVPYRSVSYRTCSVRVCYVLSVGGLGMRVVGGKLGPDKKLGTYVSTVIAGGVADKAGIVKGQFSSPDTVACNTAVWWMGSLWIILLLNIWNSLPHGLRTLDMS